MRPPVRAVLDTHVRVSALLCAGAPGHGEALVDPEPWGLSDLIDSSEPGVWVIKTAQTIPDSDEWHVIQLFSRHSNFCT